MQNEFQSKIMLWSENDYSVKQKRKTSSSSSSLSFFFRFYDENGNSCKLY